MFLLSHYDMLFTLETKNIKTRHFFRLRDLPVMSLCRKCEPGLRSTTPCMYADDTQIFSSSYDANELVVKLNSDLARVRNWLIENKLQMHPSKSKLMFIGSSYNLNNKNTEQPVVVNNIPVSRTDTH